MEIVISKVVARVIAHRTAEQSFTLTFDTCDLVSEHMLFVFQSGVLKKKSVDNYFFQRSTKIHLKESQLPRKCREGWGKIGHPLFS